MTGPEVHVSWSPLELDREAYELLSDHLAKTVDLALQLHADSAGR